MGLPSDRAAHAGREQAGEPSELTRPDDDQVGATLLGQLRDLGPGIAHPDDGVGVDAPTGEVLCRMRELLAVLRHPYAEDFKGLDPSAVMRVWRAVQEGATGTGNPGGNPGGATPLDDPALLAEMARMGK